MNQSKYVFSQILEFLPQQVFDKFVKQYADNKYIGDHVFLITLSALFISLKGWMLVLSFY